ncbi:MAG: TonB-dependent receptor domain-containing protein [Bacteroidia bacterium]
MTIRVLTLFIALSQFTFLFAQEGTLKGKITDGKTKEALGGVSIFVDGKGATTSNADGSYEIKTSAGSHSVEFKFIGYAVFSHKVEIKEGEIIFWDIPLAVAATELGVMVVSAGKFEQKLEEVTVSMDVMKQSLIQNKNTTTMQDIMQQAPGVNILGGQANIRGGSGFSYGAGSRVMVLVDDLPLLTADAGDVKWDFIPVENIKQVEIIKGASSALFGSSALNGVINFRTAYPTDTAHTSASVSSGFYDKPRRSDLVWWDKNISIIGDPLFSNVSVFHSRQIKNFDLTIGANAFLDGGYRQLETTQRYRFNFGTRYRFQKIKGLSAGLNGNYMDTHGGDFLLWKSGDSAYSPQGGKISEYHTTRATIDPFITYFSPNGDEQSLRTRFYQAVNLNNTNQQSVSDVYYAQYQYQLHLKKDLTVTNGITGMKSKVISDSLYGNHSSENIAVFSQWDKKFNRLILSFGMRAEYFKVDTAKTKSKIRLGKDTMTLPVHPVFRMGINYKLFSQTHLRASVGQGYRFPSVAEKYISTQVSGLNIYPNPQLQPETGWSAEIGAKQSFKISNFHGYVDVAGFVQEYKNMMEFTFDYYAPPGTPPLQKLQYYFGAKSINVGRAQITGVEPTIGGEGKIGKVLFTVLGGYTYIVPINLDYDPAKNTGTYNGNLLKYRYQHTAKIDLQADYKKWSAGISMRYNSFMKNIDKSFQDPIGKDIFPTLLPPYQYILPGLEEYREEHNKGDVVFDFRVSHQFIRGMKIAVIVNNIFNREYMGRPGDVMPPRTFALMLSMKL